MDKHENSYRQYISGDDSYLVDIIKEYSDGLILYINRIVNDIYISEDLMQETFVKLVTKRPRFPKKLSLKGWLYTVAHNLSIDYIRRHKQVTVQLDEIGEQLSDKTSIEHAYIRDEDKLILHRAMDHLKSEHSQAIWLVFFEDFGNRDAARIMKMTPHQFENLLYRAKGALKRELEKEGFTYEKL